MQGEVDSFATITPAYLRLYGNVGEKISGKVLILPSEKYPFNILDVKAHNGQNITYHLEKNLQSNPPEYTLIIENLMEQAGRFYDTIQLKTDHKIKPFLTIKVYGNILNKADDKTKP